MSKNSAASLYYVAPWSTSAVKRACDFLGAAVLLILLWPVMLVAALAVKLSSPGPILFRQKRPGKNGEEFVILKFRTMVSRPDQQGPVLTRAADPRVTWIGRHLRKWKVDELPQLFNVLRGQMSFVGPRPQPTKLWQQPSIQKEAAAVLSVRPGITSQATINFRNEEQLLAPLSPDEVEQVYMKHVMPLKLQMDLDYLSTASFSADLGVVFRTVFRIVNRQEEINDGLVKQCLPEAVRARRELSVEKQREYETASHGD
jgi:lipopolysaccharide/colanic/teichoic acid biosynthesis glycosyltransferase